MFLKAGIVGVLFFVVTFLSACSSEVLEQQAEQIRQQQEEIARQRKEIEALMAGQKIQEQKQRDCNRAFRDYFDKAQATSDRERTIALYQEGLTLCPDDEIAHYELGKALADHGRYSEAEKEFEAALKINPGFIDSKRHLEAVRKNR
jgi:tetratricopeptide (TPR) repeat protein